PRESKPERMEQFAALRAGCLTHARRPRAPCFLAPGLGRKHLAGGAGAGLILNHGLNRTLDHPPPNIDILKAFEIWPDGKPEGFAASDAPRFKPPAHSLIGKVVQQFRVQPTEFLDVESGRRARNLAEVEAFRQFREAPFRLERVRCADERRMGDDGQRLQPLLPQALYRPRTEPLG